MIEVYPHQALVTLFGLDRTLKCKAKQGRSVGPRRPEFQRLLDCDETLARARPPLDVSCEGRWADLRRAVETARSRSDLDRVEDEVEEYVCAYVGLLHATHAPRSRVVGDLDAGFIVVPVVSTLHPATPHEEAARLVDGPSGMPRTPRRLEAQPGKLA